MSNRHPNPPPHSPHGAVLDPGLLPPNEFVALDLEAHDNALRSVTLVHYRAMKCPVGLVDPDDIRRPHEDHAGCSNGFLYKPVGRCHASFASASLDPQKVDVGYLDGSTVQASFPRFYESDRDKRIMLRPMDRFFLDDETITAGTWDTIRRRSDGRPDRFQFPAVSIDTIVDSKGVEWLKESYRINPDGDLEWKAGMGPELGQVYSVWYEYRPFWYCERLMHDLRLVPTADFLEPDKVKMERLGPGAVLVREYVYRTQREDPKVQSKEQRRQQYAPSADDEFGQR